MRRRGFLLGLAALISPAAAEYRRDPDEDLIWNAYQGQMRVERARALAAPHDRVKLGGDWLTEGGKMFLVLDAEIANGNDFAVKDPLIICHLIANSGSIIRRLDFKLYERFEAQQTRKFPKLRIGLFHDQTRYPNCWIDEVWALPNG